MHAPTSFRLNRLISMNSEGKPGHKVYERASGNHQGSCASSITLRSSFADESEQVAIIQESTLFAW